MYCILCSKGASFRRRLRFWGRRLCFWGIGKLLHLLEVSIKCFELLVEDTLSPSVTLVGIVKVTGHLGIIAKPLKNK